MTIHLRVDAGRGFKESFEHSGPRLLQVLSLLALPIQIANTDTDICYRRSKGGHVGICRKKEARLQEQLMQQ
jgi:hypothetical protein